MLNFLHLRFFSVWFSNLLFPKKTLNYTLFAMMECNENCFSPPPRKSVSMDRLDSGQLKNHG
jgi:hypothetical protein